MYKKLIVSIVLAFCLILTACGNSQTSTETQGSEPAETAPVESVIPEAPPADEALTTIDGSTITLRDDGTGEDRNDSDMKKTVALTNREIGYVVEQGPFTITVNSVQVADIVANSDEYASFLGMETGSSAALFAVDVTVENTSGDTMYIYPDQSTIVTNTKEQVTADFFVSDSVGGAFMGNVVKSGQIFFLCKNTIAADLNQVVWHIDSPHDSNLDHIGEEIVMTFNFVK